MGVTKEAKVLKRPYSQGVSKPALWTPDIPEFKGISILYIFASTEWTVERGISNL
jgi:hypothetical protein